MTRNNRHRPVARMVSSGRGIGALLAALAALVLLPASATAATPEWRLDASAPDDILAGGRAVIDARVANVGDLPLSGDLTVAVTFPAGVALAPVAKPIDIGGTVFGSSCQVVAQTSVCTLNVDGMVPGGQLQVRWLADVEANATGTLVNVFQVSGGGMPGEANVERPMTIGPPGPFEVKEFTMNMFDPNRGSAVPAGSAPREVGNTLGFRTTASTTFSFLGEAGPSERFKDTIVHVPPGLVGDPGATPLRCTSAQLTELSPGAGSSDIPNCPQDSQVGVAHLETDAPNFATFGLGVVPVYNMVPPPGAPAAFGFFYSALTVVIVARVRPSDNGIDLVALSAPSSIAVSGVDVSLWGVPADSPHDYERHLCLSSRYMGNLAGNRCPSGAQREPFLRMPTSCPGKPLPWSVEVNTYIHPDRLLRAETTTPAVEGCEKVPFDPSLSLAPTGSAGPTTPTGLNVDLSLPQESGPDGIAEADLRRAKVTLPAGMTINPSSAHGLEVCGDGDLRLGLEGAATCPDASKLGTVELETPLLDHPLSGSVYLRPQASGDPASGDLYRLAIEIRSDDDGIDIKLPGSVQADPDTGRLTTVFDDLPQLPFSSLHLHLKAGSRAPLVTPANCGDQTTEAEFVGWNDKVAKRTSSFTVSGDAASCGAAGFQPTLTAGSESPLARAYAPFDLQVERSDRDQEFSRLDLKMPPGLLASLRGVSYCPAAALAGATAKSGGAEQASPSCPAASRVGRVLTGAGVGPSPFYVSGTAYLAGPYRGAPLSVAAVIPAVAGPFDLGTVVVRSALEVDPVDAGVEAISDPLPRIIGGTPLRIRDVRILLDRPDFTVNPTDCSHKQTAGKIFGVAPLGRPPADGIAAPVTHGFGVTNCAALAFQPQLSLRLTGKTRRGGHPALRATLTMPRRPGANIARASVALPHSEFLAQAHIRTICTRVQYAAGAGGGEQCPKGSVYGHARAYSPLLDQPLDGLVYLRSSNHPLPDLVASLGGQIHIDLEGVIDTSNGGIRTTFGHVPDAPVSKFVLTMPGGARSLLENSSDICRGKHRAAVRMGGQNGKVHRSSPLLRVRCGKNR